MMLVLASLELGPLSNGKEHVMHAIDKKIRHHRRAATYSGVLALMALGADWLTANMAAHVLWSLFGLWCAASAAFSLHSYRTLRRAWANPIAKYIFLAQEAFGKPDEGGDKS